MREPAKMGRPREFDEEVALSKILDVFWAKGFEGTALSDLMTATGLRKGSLYAAFGDKRAMYLKALALYDQRAIDGAVQLLTGAGAPKKRLDGFLRSAIDAVVVEKDRRGCFLCNASVDQAMLDPATEQAVKASVGRLRRALAELLSKLPARSTDGKQRHAEAEHILSVYFGLRVLAKAGHPIRALTDAKQAALRSLR